VKFNSRSYNNLVSKVWNHRLANAGLDVGSDWREKFDHDLIIQNGLMGTQWCETLEWYPEKSTSPLGIGDIFRFISSAARFLSSGLATVDQEEANRRAAICATCPENVTLDGCAGCHGFAGLLARVKGNLGTDRDAQLNSCKICKCALQLKVHVPLSSISNIGLEYPSFCWQRPENDQPSA